jgi:GNAT superfamily N-acetyltransferase
LNIRQIAPDDWRVYRDIRLAALREAPYAFGSTFEAEVGAAEERWRRAVTDRARFVAEIDGRVVGTVGAGAGELPDTAALTALWVEPGFRGQGVGAALVGAVIGWANGQRYETVLLWVTEANQHAERLYERLGFIRTGRVTEVRQGEPALENEMSREL